MCHTGWYSLTLDTPASSRFGTFWLNNIGLQWTPNETPPLQTLGISSQIDSYMGGWTACDWWHGYARIFCNIDFLNDNVLPSS